jgi:hypothetical protein
MVRSLYHTAQRLYHQEIIMLIINKFFQCKSTDEDMRLGDVLRGSGALDGRCVVGQDTAARCIDLRPESRHAGRVKRIASTRHTALRVSRYSSAGHFPSSARPRPAWSPASSFIATRPHGSNAVITGSVAGIAPCTSTSVTVSALQAADLDAQAWGRSAAAYVPAMYPCAVQRPSPC